jgi:hypothetical protein
MTSLYIHMKGPSDDHIASANKMPGQTLISKG